MSRVNKYRGVHIHVHPQNEHFNGTWIYGYLKEVIIVVKTQRKIEFINDCNGLLTIWNWKKQFYGMQINRPFPRNTYICMAYIPPFLLEKRKHISIDC